MDNHSAPLGRQGPMDKRHNPLFLLLFALLLSTLSGCVQHASKTASLQASSARNLTLPPATQSQQKSAVAYQSNNHHDLWQRIRDGFQLPVTHQQRFRPQMRHFLSLENFFENVAQRAEPFLYFIVDSLEQRGLPTELAFIPIIESAFKPMAHSSSKAAGIWQFIPSTGRLYNLRQDHWYDGRRDIYASTLAAINLLDDLGKQFNGDWLLAIAAYNGGPTMVFKAIEKNRRLGKATDFWSLDLRSESRRYVPKLLAVREVIRNPKRYRVNLPLIPNHPQLAKVNLSTQISLKTAAKLSELSEAETTHLNPAFKQGITAPKGVQYLLLPMEQANIFIANLKQRQRNHTPPLRVKSNQNNHYRVKKNESLFFIARRFQLKIADLRRWNRLDYGQQPRVGQLLRLTPEANVKLNAS